MKRVVATSLSVGALSAGVSTMAFGIAKFFHMDDADIQQAALALSSID